MNLMWKKMVLAAVCVLPVSAVFANDCPIAPGDGPPQCAAEVPEPSSPLLFLAAAGVAGVVLKIRKKK